MADKRLEKCRESYQITNCKLCNKPTINFNYGNICGGYKRQIKLKENSE